MGKQEKQSCRRNCKKKMKQGAEIYNKQKNKRYEKTTA